MKKLFSPLRYPGGKGKTFEMIKELLKSNDLFECVYIEPFAGGSSLALRLLYEGLVSRVIINDYDKSIYSFWYSIKYYNKEFCDKIENTDVSIDEWHRQKSIQLRKFEKDISLFELGFSTFFLNRTNRSGIIEAGPIGGYEQKGNYKIDCRFNKMELIERIRKFKNYSSNIEIRNDDANLFIKHNVSRLKNNCFLFIDPPYYKKGKQLYMNFFNHDDHKNLERTIRKLRKPYIITYDDEEQIRNIYSNYEIKSYKLTYTVEKKYIGSELIIYNKELISLPDNITEKV